jgi:hypothetical protein
MTAMIEGQPMRNAHHTVATRHDAGDRLTACRP